jgi:hypothetical protein
LLLVSSDPATVLQPIGRPEPDLDLIKQVEQVTMFVLEGPTRRFARIRSIRDQTALEILVLLFWQLLARLIFRYKKQQKQPGVAEGALFRSARPACPGRPGNSTNRATRAVDLLRGQLR